MTTCTWTIALHDGRTVQVEADEITTRNDGSLRLLRAAAPPPDKLAVVLVLARGQWLTVRRADEPILFAGEPEHDEVPVPRFA
jgi:hypothetical protein